MKILLKPFQLLFQVLTRINLLWLVLVPLIGLITYRILFPVVPEFVLPTDDKKSEVLSDAVNRSIDVQQENDQRQRQLNEQLSSQVAQNESAFTAIEREIKNFVPEGSFTDRVSSRIKNSALTFRSTTDDLVEGSKNLYYTRDRAKDSAKSVINDEYVSWDKIDLRGSDLEDIEVASYSALLDTPVIANVPVGGIVWLHPDALDGISEYWVPCNGQTITEGVLAGKVAPDINGSNLFVRGSNSPGVVQDDTTAVNGLSVESNGSHTHTYSFPNFVTVAITYYSAVSTGATSGSLLSNSDSLSTSEESDHTHPLQGDSETRPDNISLHCILRIK